MSIASTDDFSDLASVNSDSTDSGEALEDLKASIKKLTEQLEKLKSEGKDEKEILTSIIGSWRIVSSTGMKEYLENFSEAERSGMFGAVFEAGVPNFFLDENNEKMTLFNAIGSQQHNKKTVKLGEKCVVNGIKEVTFVEKNSLITVAFQNANSSEEFSREKRYVKDGQLHIVTKRFGMKCTRIYEKALTMNYSTTEPDGVKELRGRFVKLEEEFVQQKEALVKEHEQQKIEWERQLEIAQKSNESISTELKLAIKKAAELEENPEEFKEKVLGTWYQIDGLHFIQFLKLKEILTVYRPDCGYTQLTPVSNKAIQRTLNYNESNMSIASTDDFSDLASVKSDSTFSGEALEELRSTIQKLATDMEHIKSREGNDSVEKLKVKNAELEATIQKLTEEIEKLKGGVKKDEEDILSSIIGSWQMVSSIGMKEYVQNRNENFQSGLWLTIFETGLPNFSYDEKDEKLTVFFAVGSQEFFNQTVKLGEKSVVNGMKEVTFVEDNSLVTVYFHENGKDEIWRVEKYLKDGQLRIVSKRFGLRCTRIYEKVGRERQMDQCEVEVLRKRIAELEAQVAGKDSQVQMDENQKVERLEQKNEELKAQIVDLVSKIEELDDLRKQTILDIARSSQAKHTDTPDTFSTKLLGRWEQINGGVEDCIKFIFINRELYMRNISHDVPFKRASNEDIQKALRQSNFDSQYSDRMAVSSDYTHGESRKCVYFFVGDNLVVCETGLEVLLKEKTPVKVYSKSSNYNYKVRAYKKTIVN